MNAKLKKSLSRIFNLASVGSGLVCAIGGAVAAAAFGLPLAAVPIAAMAAGLGAGGSSSLCNAFLGACYDGKGPDAGVAGLMGSAAAHVTLVPTAAVIVARCALASCGFIL